MKQLKIFIIISFVLLLVATLAVGFVWYKLQITIQNAQEDGETVNPEIVVPVTTPVAKTVPAQGVTIPNDAISSEQKAAAKKVGLDLDSITITPSMVQCAEVKIGSSRVQAILEGGTPSALESVSLLSCL